MSRCRWVCVGLLIFSVAAGAQEVTLTARVELVNGDKTGKSQESGNVVVWLVPASGAVEVNGVRIDARDGAAIKDAAVVKITAIEDSELVLVDTP